MAKTQLFKLKDGTIVTKDDYLKVPDADKVGSKPYNGIRGPSRKPTIKAPKTTGSRNIGGARQFNYRDAMDAELKRRTTPKAKPKSTTPSDAKMIEAYDTLMTTPKSAGRDAAVADLKKNAAVKGELENRTKVKNQKAADDRRTQWRKDNYDPQVKAIQQEMFDAGIITDKKEIDGLMGPKTEAAMEEYKDFRSAEHKANMDGYKAKAKLERDEAKAVADFNAMTGGNTTGRIAGAINTSARLGEAGKAQELENIMASADQRQQPITTNAVAGVPQRVSTEETVPNMQAIMDADQFAFGNAETDVLENQNTAGANMATEADPALQSSVMNPADMIKPQPMHEFEGGANSTAIGAGQAGSDAAVGGVTTMNDKSGAFNFGSMKYNLPPEVALQVRNDPRLNNPTYFAENFAQYQMAYGNNRKSVGGSDFFVEAADNAATQFACGNNKRKMAYGNYGDEDERTGRSGTGGTTLPNYMNSAQAIYDLFNRQAGGRSVYSPQIRNNPDNRLPVKPEYTGELEEVIIKPKGGEDTSTGDTTDTTEKVATRVPEQISRVEGLGVGRLAGDEDLGLENTNLARTMVSGQTEDGVNAKDKSARTWDTVSNLGGQAVQFGASLIDNYKQKAINDRARERGVPDPTYLNNVRLDKNVDISADIAEMQDALGEYNTQVMRNTTNSADALNRQAAARIDTAQGKGRAMTDAYNQERGLRNQQTMLDAETAAYNAKQLDDYKMNVHDLNVALDENDMDRVNNLQGDITSGIDRYNMTKYQDEILDLEKEKYRGGSGVDAYTSSKVDTYRAWEMETDPAQKAKYAKALKERFNINVVSKT